MTRKTKDFSGRWISADIASRLTGIALWQDRRCLSVRTIKGCSAHAWSDVFTDCSRLVLEGGYVGLNKSSSLVLASSRGRVEMAAEFAGCTDIHRLQPSTWRKAVGLRGHDRKSLKQAAKRQCAWLAANPKTRPHGGPEWDGYHFPHLVRLSEDEADAVLIGLAYIRLNSAR